MSKNIKESQYSIEELATSEKIFNEGISPDCVIAALRISGCEKYTIENAKQIVAEFMTKEVK